jgi:hypothetical protein
MADGLSFHWVQPFGYALFWLLSAFALYQLFHALLPNLNRRFRLYALPTDSGMEQRIPRMLRRLLIPRKAEVREIYKALLQASGAGIPAALYFVLKRTAAGAASVFLLWGMIGMGQGGTVQVWCVTMSVMILIAIGFDRVWLEAAGRRRRSRIIAEIYTLCHQLSYYAGSAMNLHGKLSRCAPFTARIRREWQQLLNEWYEDPDEALHRFRSRLGTEEAYSFAETLNALRLGESEAFYRLLRQRIADYKAQLELLKEGRRESFSYVLFVLAGLPIMNTFRVFIYPWVREGQKLFDALK